MKLEEAIQRLDLSAGTSAQNKSVRIKQRFSNILQEVKYKDLSGEQLLIIEKELEEIFRDLDLEAKNVDVQLKRRLRILLKHLRENFALVPEGYCTESGLRFGLITGLVIMLFLLLKSHSLLMFYTPLGGLLLGFILGSLCDHRRKSKGKSLLTRMV